MYADSFCERNRKHGHQANHQIHQYANKLNVCQIIQITNSRKLFVIALAQKQGEISGERDAKCRARSLVMSIYGLRTYGYTHPKADDLRELAKQVLKDISV